MKPGPGEATRVVDASFVAGAVDPGALLPPTLLEIAIAGRSNVGKSSLLNALTERRGLARTSNTPGCTRQLNLFEVRCADGLTLRLVDIPGYGWARRSRLERAQWQAMIEGYLTARASLRALVLIVDVRRGPGEEEVQLVEFLRRERSGAAPIAVIWVATKLDKLGLASRKPALEKVRRAAGRPVVGFSAVTGEGRRELWQSIREALAGASAVG